MFYLYIYINISLFKNINKNYINGIPIPKSKEIKKP